MMRWRSFRAARPAGGRDRGLTLIELLVTMVLLGVVSTLVVTAVAQSVRILRHTDDEAIGLNDAKTVLDRLGRDIREARGVTCDGGLADPTDPSTADPGCNAHLQLWVDANSNYAQEDDEIVTWRLQANPDGVHYDVWRIVGTGATPISSHKQASTLIVNIAFHYDTANAQDAQEVSLDMRYNAIAAGGAGDRVAAFSARLRNKG